MKQFSPKIARLMMEADDRNVIGDVFISQPDKKIGTKLGIIFGIIELFELPEEFTDNFTEIINDLKTEYYLPPLETDHGVEKRFEECLQRANRRISLLIQNFDEDEVNLENINILICLSHLDRIFLSQIGKLDALLFHQSKSHNTAIINILKQATQPKKQKLDQEKMFSNIISGEITTSDSVIFHNNNISEHLSQNELSEILTNYDLTDALQEIETILGESNTKNSFYLAAIQPDITKESIASPEKDIGENTENLKSTTPQDSLNRLVNTQKKTEEYLTPSMMPNWQKLLIITLAGIVKSFKQTAGFINRLFNRSIKKSTKSIKIKKEEKIETADQPEKIETPQPEDGENIEPTKKITADKHLGIFKPAVIAKNISDWINVQIATFLKLNKFQKILLIISLLLVFLFSQSIVLIGKRNTNSQKTDIQVTTSQVEELINIAEARNIFNDEDGAKESVLEALDLLATIPNSRQYDEFKNQLQERIDRLNHTLQKITYLNEPVIIANLNNTNSEANTTGLTKINNNIIVLDNQNHSLYQIDLEQKQTTTLTLSDEIGQITKIAPLNESKIILFNNKNEFWQYSFTDNMIEKVLAINNRVVDFDIYSNKIYTLQSDNNQIYKHLATSIGFNNGSAWVNDSSEVKNVVAMAIDGGIYLVDNTGQIQYMIKGKQEETNFVAIEPRLESPTQIYSHLDSNYLYILDKNNQRIVVFEKNGNLKIQYNSKEFKDIKSMLVVENEKIMYLLSENKIYQIDITF